mmetsp:Transcript_26015/g.60937  ORF Transcript_26015/g.60937 Transcript_26015/m.60937 type:complete len:253 (-) Transcript_26015:154-912(-)
MQFNPAGQQPPVPPAQAFEHMSMGGMGGAMGAVGGMGGMAPMAPSAAEQAAHAAAGGGGGAGEPLLGVICPGRPMTCAWQITEATRAVMVDHITAANEVPDILIALLPDRPFLSSEQAAIIYWTSDGANWSLLGAIAQQKPSAMLRTGWGTALEPGAVVQLAVSIEPMQVAANLGLDMLAAGGHEERRTFARAIARDLWNFLTSFSQKAPSGGAIQTNGEMMLIPTNVLDSWLKRFDSKYARDPNFMMKGDG